ncbi:MAG: hypothetical protein NTU69_12830 [Proteobacteria bacterium]|nr:hypothetical protein [Pseudomonadota bacterium]
MEKAELLEHDADFLDSKNNLKGGLIMKEKEDNKLKKLEGNFKQARMELEVATKKFEEMKAKSVGLDKDMAILRESKIEQIEEEKGELLEKFVSGEIEEKVFQQCQQEQRKKQGRLKELKQLQEATNRVIGKLKNSLYGLQEKEREAQVELLAYVLENIKEKIKETAGDLVNQATAIQFLKRDSIITIRWDKAHYGVFLTSIFPMPSLEEHAKMKKQIEGEILNESI